jgi:hypothetical protein
MIKVITLLFLIYLPLFSTETVVNNADAELFDFININYDARSTALGGVHSVLSSGGLLIGASSASLTDQKIATGVVSVKPYLLDIMGGAIAGAYRLENGLVLSPELVYLSFGSIDAVDEYGDSLGVVVSPFSYAIRVSAAYKFLKILSSSASIKFIRENLANDSYELDIDEIGSMAVLFDAGFRIDFTKTVIAAGFRNVGFLLKEYEGFGDVPLPTSIYCGVSVKLPTEDVDGNFYFEVEKSLANYLSFKGALEVLPFKKYVAIRVGSSVTSDEISQLFSLFSGDVSSKDSYSKRNWSLVNAGFGIDIPVKESHIFFDAAAEFRLDGVKPGFTFSGGYSF